MPNTKLSIRPILAHLNATENKNPEEQFQNLTLRPIIKMQHNLLLAFFHNHLQRKKIKFTELNPLKKNAVIETVFKNDTQFKTELRGLIIGHFTIEEYNEYQPLSSEFNKRIINIIKERLQSLNT